MQDLLATLASLNVQLEVRDGKLHVSAAPGVLTTELQSRMREHRDALIAGLQQEWPAQAPEPDFLVPDPGSRRVPFPLNDVQHAYWMGRQAQFELGGVSSHNYFELDCTQIDFGKLQAAFNQVIQRHDMLRAVVDPSGQQRVLDWVPDYEIHSTDLRNLEPSEASEALLRIRGELSERQISCETWPLFEIRAAQQAGGRTRLFLSWDFIFIDAWSLLLIFRQWHESYVGSAALVPMATELSFRDYVLEEARQKTSAAYQADLRYWLDRVDTLPSAPLLPMHAPGTAPSAPHRFTRRTFVLPAETWQLLKERARRAGITPSSLLLATFADVLGRWSKDQHYCLNLTLFNRRPFHPDVGELVGDFTNLLLLEVDGREGGNFISRAKRLQDQFLRDFEHRQVSAIEVLRELARRRSDQFKATMPVVFTSTLMLDGTGSNGGGLEQFGSMVWGLSQTPQVSLDYQIFEIDGRLQCNWDAVDELFLPGVLDNMFEANRERLVSLANFEETWTTATAPQLPALQLQNRLSANDTAAAVETDCLHDGFVTRALQSPDRIAIRSGAQVLGYGELLALAAKLSEELVAAGVRPNQLVAVVMEKGWEQIVAVLAILLSGAAYLPIDPSWPKLRRDEILERSDVRIVFTPPGFEASQWADCIRCIPIAAGLEIPMLSEAPSRRQLPSDLAYVIYTSGSTGIPKGVMIDHRGALNTVAHVNRLFALTDEDRVLALSELSFDLSVFDIFGTLSAGGMIVIPEARLNRDPGHWCKLVQEQQVTVWNSAPQLMSLAVDWVQGSAEAELLQSLRLVMLSGDWISTSLPDRIRSLAPTAKIVSLGGATEGSIWSIYHVIDRVDSNIDSIPYGMPLPNQHMFVLNKSMDACPDSVTGDIYIGGAGVALGYWNDPERTQQRFLQHPESGERLYWTGDLGRYLADGNIEFLGREDSQVKIRGYRVELGEISTALQSHPCIRDAAVRVIKGDERSVVCAYVVADEAPGSSLFGLTEIAASHALETYERMMHAGRAQAAMPDRVALVHFSRFWAEIQTVCLRSMVDTLVLLGVIGSHDTAQLRFNALAAQGRLQPGYTRLLARWLVLLEAEGEVSSTDGRYTRREARDQAGPGVDEQLLRIEQTFGDQVATSDFVRYVGSCLRGAQEILTGAIKPLELLFPEGSWRYARALYKENAIVRHHNKTIAALVKSAVASADDASTFRVLEIGAGTGGTTEALLAELPPGRTQYHYTDVSSYFFSKAREAFSAFGFISYLPLDVNKDPTSLGFESGSYDLVIAANAIHNADDLDLSLGYLRKLLKPGGHLILLEGTAITPWSMATVGFLEGAESYSDDRARDDLPVLSAADWAAALEKNRFTRVETFPGTDGACADAEHALLSAMQQHVILARGPLTAMHFQPAELVRFLSDRLPDYMIPQRFILLDHLPLSANGKVNLSALPDSELKRGPDSRKIVPPGSTLEETILQVWKDVLGVDQLSVVDNFFEVGGDSLQVIDVHKRLNSFVERKLLIADLFTYPSVQSLAEFLRGDAEVPGKVAAPPAAGLRAASSDIAIIGLSGRFPDATTPQQLWENVAAGLSAVRHFSDQELLDAGVHAHELAHADYVRAAPVLADMDRFDAAFFGIAPAEAEVMDPQQRFLLECAVEALESAGYPDERSAGRIGVFSGKGLPLYLVDHVLGRQDIVARLGLHSVLRSHEKDHASPLISYKLNLTGPSLSINTSCSTSLVAVHAACQSLLLGECEIAMAGGASFVTTLARSGYIYHPGQIFSPDGYCRAFSDQANGTIFACGVGLVVLKPLANALRDRDTIHAVIKGSSVNNDGARKVGYSAPGVDGQVAAIVAAQAAASVSPDSIQYIEAHGTGTSLGDSIEFEALRKVFGGRLPGGPSVALGSIKTNIGHLDSAAGVTGLIKVVEALKRKMLPPSLHAAIPSRQLDFAASPFYINTTLKPWTRLAQARRAGVSSFGVGGTNVHAILEEAPEPIALPGAEPEQLLILSAKSPDALVRQSMQLAAHLATNPALPLAQVAFTLQVGRTAHRFRRHLVCRTQAEVVLLLENASPASVATREKHATRLAFLFPGQGTPFLGRTRALYRTSSVYRQALDLCAELVSSYCGLDLRETLHADSADTIPTSVAQPLLFSAEYALAKYWISLGARPTAFLGHSLGEYVAACLAGVFTLEEALSLVVARGTLMQALPSGAMAAVACSDSVLAPHLDGSGCSIAAVNSNSQCVVSGPVAEMDALRGRLEASGLTVSTLKTSHAFHSAMMEPILEVYGSCVAQVSLLPPTVPFVSSMTGTWITDEQATSVEYWVRHLRQPVQFSTALSCLGELDGLILLEVGPGRILSTLARAAGFPQASCIAPHASPTPEAEAAARLDAIGRLWSQGINIDWDEFSAGHGCGRIPLPTYPFEKNRYWIERTTVGPIEAGTSAPVAAAQAHRFEPEAAVARDSEAGNFRGSMTPDAYLEPSNETERELARIWQEFLGIPQIGVQDNFFDLGGDSLLGTRVYSKIVQVFGIQLPIEKVFELSTIRRQSLFILTSKDPSAIDCLSEDDLDELSEILGRPDEPSQARTHSTIQAPKGTQ